VLKVLKSFGFDLVRQHGSHMILRNKEGNYVVVPRHDPIKEPTLKSILDQAGLSKDEFIRRL
jgi:predicted RNA binding protein YcfA (HicA-like mRNA interferase family)